MDPFDEKPHRHDRTVGKGPRSARIRLLHSRLRRIDVFIKMIHDWHLFDYRQHKAIRASIDETSDFGTEIRYSVNKKYRWQYISSAYDFMLLDAHTVPKMFQVVGADVFEHLGHRDIFYNHHWLRPDNVIAPVIDNQLVYDSPVNGPPKKVKMKPRRRALRQTVGTMEASPPPKPRLGYYYEKVHPVEHYFGTPNARFKYIFPKLSSGRRQEPFVFDDFCDYDGIDNGFDELGDQESSDNSYETPKRADFVLFDFIVNGLIE